MASVSPIIRFGFVVAAAAMVLPAQTVAVLASVILVAYIVVHNGRTVRSLWTFGSNLVGMLPVWLQAAVLVGLLISPGRWLGLVLLVVAAHRPLARQGWFARAALGVLDAGIAAANAVERGAAKALAAFSRTGWGWASP
ncbi:MAG: hypothetical protein ACYDAG_18165 [Chloroflexota bacterium]